MASVVGVRYGRRRWPNTKKTLEGTAAGIVASLVVSAVLYIWCPPSLAFTPSQMLGYAVCLTLAGRTDMWGSLAMSVAAGLMR